MITLVQRMLRQFNDVKDQLSISFHAGYQTAQIRYNQKRAIAKHGPGYVPKVQQSRLDKQLHELEVGLRWEMKGVQQVLDFLDTMDDLDEDTRNVLRRRIGDVDEFLNNR